MTKLKRIEIRVTKRQHEQIIANAHATGYVTISTYMRDRGLYVVPLKAQNSEAKQETLQQHIRRTA